MGIPNTSCALMQYLNNQIYYKAEQSLFSINNNSLNPIIVL